VEQRSTSHAVRARDVEGFARYSRIGRAFVGAVGDIGLFESMFLHQPVGERKGGFGFGLGRVRMIRSFENGANLFDHVVKLP
jgi:hypothetical protein